MKELSLNILDIAQNSITAGAKLTEITIRETEEQMIISVSDNGCGMSKELLASVTDPFCTTRKTRKVGLGIPLFRLAAEQTGGHLEITSVSEKDDPGSPWNDHDGGLFQKSCGLHAARRHRFDALHAVSELPRL